MASLLVITAATIYRVWRAMVAVASTPDTTNFEEGVTGRRGQPGGPLFGRGGTATPGDPLSGIANEGGQGEALIPAFTR